ILAQVAGLKSFRASGSKIRSAGSQIRGAGSQIRGAGSQDRGAGSQNRGAGSETRRDPAEFNHCVQRRGMSVLLLPRWICQRCNIVTLRKYYKVMGICLAQLQRKFISSAHRYYKSYDIYGSAYEWNRKITYLSILMAF